MNHLLNYINQLPHDNAIEKSVLIRAILGGITSADYVTVDIDDKKPWGAYFRIDGSQADRFIEEFFPGLSPSEARLGNESAELSPKILLVSPNQRLSWQYHSRRSERWMFLTEGGYYRSTTDNEGELVSAHVGDVVQFTRGERHRLVADANNYTIVAEIWQHTDADVMSNEADIVRISDDYSR